MLIEGIKLLKQGTVIPKPDATAEFKIKGWGVRRGEQALIYSIPNHRSPTKNLEKGITVSEFELCYVEIMSSKLLTRAWFNSNLSRCAKEGSCNFTTIGGILQLLGLAQYAGRGSYVSSKGRTTKSRQSNLPPLGDNG